MIETERLLFREYTPGDLDLLLRMTSDPEVMRYIRHGRPWSREETMEALHRFLGWNAKGIGLYLAFRKDDGGFAGHSGLVPQIVEGIQELEVGYWVVKDLWGKGYGFEQASAWKEHGFNRLGEKRLISLIQMENIGSRKVAEKNGMKHERDINLNGRCVAVYSIEKS